MTRARLSSSGLGDVVQRAGVPEGPDNVYIYIYIHIYVCMYVYIYIYIYTCILMLLLLLLLLIIIISIIQIERMKHNNMDIVQTTSNHKR